MQNDPGKTQGKAPAATQGREATREKGSLDACYGRIGIPAVAAALTPRHDEPRRDRDRRVTPYDRD